jgi:gliding motility-associatede transport system auxiliary component
MNRGLLTSAGLLLALVLVVSLNVLAANTFSTARLDLTEDKLFTLSDGSRHVLKGLQEPITLRFYFSKSLANTVPQVMRYGERVREMIEEYATVANGMIRLEIIDPVPFTDDEDDAVRNGLQALPVSSSDNLYFGLVGTNSVDDREVIKFFNEDKENFLEYDLTRLVYNLSAPKKPVVGLITAHRMNADVSPMLQVGGQGPQQWAIVPLIRQTFELQQIYPEAETIPDDIDLLLIAHPGELSEKMLYQIDQFVMRGGRAVVAVDPFSEVALAFRQTPTGMPGVEVPDHSSLPKLLKAWGVQVEDEKFVGDWQLARRVNVGIPGKVKIMRYLSWLAFEPDRFNHDDVVMSGLGPINMASAGAISAVEGATTKMEPLITTSPESMLFDAKYIRLGPNPEVLLKNFKADGKSYVVAARVTGKAKSAFPDGPPQPQAKAKAGDEAKTGEAEKEKDEGKAKAKPFLAESARDIAVIVFADSDFLFDQFWVREQNFLGENVFVATAANADMVVNALDNLSGSEDLIGLRGRGKSERRFEVMSDIRRAAEKAYQSREEALAEKLKETQKRLNELQGSASAGGGALLSKAQEEEIAKARQDIVDTRRALRDVQHDLNKDIDRLETQIKFANIGLVPLLIGLIALVLALVRHQRRRASASRPRH